MKLMLLFRFVSLIIAVYLFYVLFLYAMQRKIMFPGQDIDPLSGSSDAGRSILKSWLKTSSGAVETWMVTPDTSQPERYPALLFAHGNFEIIDHVLEEALLYRQKGLNVFLVEYPGYGRSEGTPTRANLLETFRMAYDFLTDTYRVPANRIFFFGRSLGGGPLCDLLMERVPAGLILQSTFTNLTDFAHRFLLPGFLIRDRFDNLIAVGRYQGPVLIFHGRADDVIPFRHGVKLARAAANARFVAQDCAHNDCPPDWDAYRSEILYFISENILE